jgi:hypothetical protein
MQRRAMAGRIEVCMSLIYKGKLEPRARVELATCRLRIGCSTTELPRPIDNKRLIGLFRTTPTILRHSCVEVHSNSEVACPSFNNNTPPNRNHPPAQLIGDYSTSILTLCVRFPGANETPRSHPWIREGKLILASCHATSFASV